MRVSRVCLLGVALFAACYQQPQLSRNQPLKCSGDASNDCPAGFQCVVGVCASKACKSDLDCPVNLVCGPRGCLLPGPPGDGGALETGGRSDDSGALPLDAAGDTLNDAGGSDAR